MVRVRKNLGNLQSMPFILPIKTWSSTWSDNENYLTYLLWIPPSSVFLQTLHYQGFPLFCNCHFASQFVLSNWHLYMHRCFPPFKKIPFSISTSLQFLVYVSSLTVQGLKGTSCTHSSHFLTSHSTSGGLVSILTTLPKVLSQANNWSLLGLYIHLSNILSDLSIVFDTVQILPS